jgi:hypothetical protein
VTCRLGNLFLLVLASIANLLCAAHLLVTRGIFAVAVAFSLRNY